MVIGFEKICRKKALILDILVVKPIGFKSNNVKINKTIKKDNKTK